jgi:hypothetical protein
MMPLSMRAGENKGNPDLAGLHLNCRDFGIRRQCEISGSRRCSVSSFLVGRLSPHTLQGYFAGFTDLMTVSENRNSIKVTIGINHYEMN